MRPITLEQAQRQYPHRYTMQHIPQWARKVRVDGSYYAPGYRTDAEWYANTEFPGEGSVGKREQHCHSSNPSWPLGQKLQAPLKFPSEI